MAHRSSLPISLKQNPAQLPLRTTINFNSSTFRSSDFYCKHNDYILVSNVTYFDRMLPMSGWNWMNFKTKEKHFFSLSRQYLVLPFWDFFGTTYSRVRGCHAKYVKTNTTCLFYCTRETLRSIKAYSSFVWIQKE